LYVQKGLSTKRTDNSDVEWNSDFSDGIVAPLEPLWGVDEPEFKWRKPTGIYRAAGIVVVLTTEHNIVDGNNAAMKTSLNGDNKVIY
jgi:hypothetical protein